MKMELGQAIRERTQVNTQNAGKMNQEQIREFPGLSTGIEFAGTGRSEVYNRVERVTVRASSPAGYPASQPRQST